MRDSNDLFDTLFRIVLKNTFNPQKTGKDDNRAENELMMAAVALLAFVGADALKVVFRKNFGRDGFSMFRVVLSFIAFLLIAGIGFYLGIADEDIDPAVGTPLTFLLGGVFYTLLGFYVLLKGILHKRRSKQLSVHPTYRGDSHLLAFLIKNSGWSQSSVQNWAEPLFTLVLGCLLASINLLWGAPLVFCALSVWGYQIVEYLFAANPVADRVQKNGYSQDDDFTPTRY